MNRRNWICCYFGAVILLVGSSSAWAECPEGKVEATMYTPNGNVHTICVSDNALSGIENANEHHTTVEVCPEVTCPCWDADKLESLVTLDSPECWEDYRQLSFTGADSVSGNVDILFVLREPDFYGGYRACGISPPVSNGEPSLWYDADIRVENLSQAEADACAEILRASKWWNSECSEIGGDYKYAP